MDYRWNEWNVDHLEKHGVDPEEAESVVEEAVSPFPMPIGNNKLLAWGRGRGGRLLQVIFVTDEDGTAFVIHARELTRREKHNYRRRTQ